LVAVSRLIGISPWGIVRLFEAESPCRASFAGHAFAVDLRACANARNEFALLQIIELSFAMELIPLCGCRKIWVG
jgi:hypothetical protein